MSKENKIKEILTRGVHQVTEQTSLEKKLKTGKKLRIKHGVDPTTKDLHIGYAVVYNKLKELQDMGHTIIFMIGDFTARFGDPTDKEKARTLRDGKEIKDLAKDYINQLGKILDLKKTEIRYNSEWYDKMKADELLHLMSHFTAQRMMERDMFDKRLKKGEAIGLHELAYPVLQAYDSVMLKSDVTVIGTDQIFNELKGREIQKDFGQVPQDIVAMKILAGTDGKVKMSQSLGNYIGITESASEQFGKVMSIPDTAIVHYFELATTVADKQIKKIEKELADGTNPRDIKVKLAKEVVSIYHGEKEALKAEEEFNRIFSKKEKPESIEIKTVTKKEYKVADLIFELEMATSKSEARRLIDGGAVRFDDAVIGSREAVVTPTNKMIVQVGKRKFVELRVG